MVTARKRPKRVRRRAPRSAGLDGGAAGDAGRGVLRPIQAGALVQLVEMGDIDGTDRRFQFRLQGRERDLRRSLATDGQQVPITLWGGETPYTIIDGFGRFDAATELGWRRIHAILRKDLTETQAFALAFLDNVRRSRTTALDRANAIWKATHERGMGKFEVATALDLSHRQVERYLEVTAFPTTVARALRSGDLTMAHAFVLAKAKVEDPVKWIDAIRESDLSAAELRRQINNGRKNGRPGKLLLQVNGGFRLRAIDYRGNVSREKKERIERALQRALQIVRGE